MEIVNGSAEIFSRFNFFWEEIYSNLFLFNQYVLFEPFFFFFFFFPLYDEDQNL